MHLIRQTSTYGLTFSQSPVADPIYHVKAGDAIKAAEADYSKTD